MSIERGRFITIEGGEGTGKSTQIARLIDRLSNKGIAVERTREPGGSKGAERIRSLILAAGETRFDPLTETLLFYAARNDHLNHVIRPALALGHWVVSDRFSDSTRVYQGLMGAVSRETLVLLDTLVVAETQPDLTIILDLPADIGLERANRRRGDAAADGFEAESLAFHEGLRQGFLALASENGERCVIVDASGSKTEVAQRIWECVEARLLAHGDDRP